MSYILLGLDDIKSLLRARDLCAVHSHVNASAAAAKAHLVALLRSVALDPAAKALEIPEEEVT
jgi:hypothetical protein